MELSLNEKKYLKKVIKKYPKKKIYKLIKKKDNLEISNDLKSLLTKMENVNFMDNYYEDMIGGMNNNGNRKLQGQQLQGQQLQGQQQLQLQGQQLQGQQGAMVQGVKNLAPQTNFNNAMGNMTDVATNLAPQVHAPQTNFRNAMGNMTGSLNQLKEYIDNPTLLQKLIENVKGKEREFVQKIGINNLSANLSYDNNFVSEAVESYLNFLKVPPPLNKLFGRFYFNFVLMPYIQSNLQANIQANNMFYPTHQKNLVESPISDMYNNNINSYAPHMYYPINYNLIEKYPMDNYYGYYN